jgi:F420-dependent oxidoreductase-like protein
MSMRIGIFGGGTMTGDDPVSSVVTAAREAAEQGFASFWMPQIFQLDALTTLAVVGREVPGIFLGTSVVPTYPRHPMVLAQQALTVQVATGNRLMLGIGLSHQVVVEGMWGYSFDKPARHMREYLDVLQPLLAERAVSFEGETLKGAGTVDVGGAAQAPPVLLAALAPRMLELAGSRTDGTVTWMTGPATIESHIVPSIGKAAADAGRPTPHVCVGLPVCVTDDVDGARERAAAGFAVYGHLPSYRAMLDKEGAAGPADVAIVGDEATVEAGIRRVAEAGGTDFAAAEFPGTDDERRRTRDLLRSLL